MDSKPPSQNAIEERPPLFGSWPKFYGFVIAFFVVEVALFYAFTRFFS